VSASEEVAKQINEAVVSTGFVTQVSKTKHMKINRNIINLEEDLIMNG
jgi:hypothetical protein